MNKAIALPPEMLTKFNPETKADRSVIIESGLIFLGILTLFFMSPYKIVGDGVSRFYAISELLTQGTISDMPYSMIGPLFSVPLWLLGKLYKSSAWWCARYNFFVFCGGLFLFYRLLRNHVDRSVVRKFLLILIAASMFSQHVTTYYGEVFSALLVGAGILAIALKYSYRWWGVVILGVANTPAAVAGLVMLVLKQAIAKKRWRYFMVLVAAVGIICVELWIRHGDPFTSGYAGNSGYRTLLPYSGKPGFSYPFFFGLISILFSFGKGILFFAPGLLLIIKRRNIKPEIYDAYKLWICFLIGLILVYAKWWSWYGGWFWGPRFFLFASIAASFALAVNLQDSDKSLIANLSTLVALCLSVWVSISGAVFGTANLGICLSNNYALESFCWYMPEFSVLWRPFVVSMPLKPQHIITIVYHVIVFAYLVFPLLQMLARQINTEYKSFKLSHLNFKDWRY